MQSSRCTTYRGAAPDSESSEEEEKAKRERERKREREGRPCDTDEERAWDPRRSGTYRREIAP